MVSEVKVELKKAILDTALLGKVIDAIFDPSGNFKAALKDTFQRIIEGNYTSMSKASLLKAVIVAYAVTRGVEFAKAKFDEAVDSLAKISKEHAIKAAKALKAAAEAKIAQTQEKRDAAKKLEADRKELERMELEAKSEVTKRQKEYEVRHGHWEEVTKEYKHHTAKPMHGGK
jgi:hypothetical protein